MFEPTPSTSKQIIEDLVRYEKDQNTPKNMDSMLQRLINAHLESKLEGATPFSDVVLASEAVVTMWGGIIDLSNIVPFGTFMISQDLQLQQRLYEELKSTWADLNTPVPSYEVLRHLPLLVSALSSILLPNRWRLINHRMGL